MNILDFESDKIEGEVLKNIFDYTKNIFFNFYKEKQPMFKNIEIPLDLDTYEGQYIMKDFLEMRVAEELSELLEAVEIFNKTHNNNHKFHIYEELVDGFNFLVNSYILYGWDYDKFEPIEELWKRKVPISPDFSFDAISRFVLDIHYRIGLTCNKLKIRPWKQSQYMLDVIEFEERFKTIFYSYIKLIFFLQIDPDLLWDFFDKKNKCNNFRIETGY